MIKIRVTATFTIVKLNVIIILKNQVVCLFAYRRSKISSVSKKKCFFYGYESFDEPFK